MNFSFISLSMIQVRVSAPSAPQRSSRAAMSLMQVFPFRAGSHCPLRQFLPLFLFSHVSPALINLSFSLISFKAGPPCRFPVTAIQPSPLQDFHSHLEPQGASGQKACFSHRCYGFVVKQRIVIRHKQGLRARDLARCRALQPFPVR